MTIEEQIAKNKRNSTFVMIGFSALVTVIGLFIGYLAGWMTSDDAGGIWTITLIVAGAFLVAALGYSLYIYYNTTSVFMGSVNGRKLEPENASLAEKQLLNVIDELQITAEIPLPEVYLVEDQEANAFATGRDPEHAAIGVNTGLLEMMNREELKSVLAHEMSHIKNYDIRSGSITVALTSFIAGAGYFLVELGEDTLWFGDSGRSNRKKDDDKSSAMIGLVMLIGGWLIQLIGVPIATLMQLALSRQRESLADISGVDMTQDPQGLIDALTKLKGDQVPSEYATSKAATLCFRTPLSKKDLQEMKDNDLEEPKKRKFNLTNLLDTHPPLDDRIEQLKKLIE